MKKKQILLLSIIIYGAHNFAFSQRMQERQMMEDDAHQTFEELKNIDISDFSDEYDIGEIDISQAREVNEEDLDKYLGKYSNRRNLRNFKELRAANDKSKLWLQTLENESHKDIVSRFKAADVSAEELHKMNSSYETFRANPTQENYQNYLKTVSDFADKHDRWCYLTVETIPRNGATIKYRLLEEKQTFSMGASEASKRVKLGFYTIWSERNGKQTSSKNDICECIQETELYTIEEHSEE